MRTRPELWDREAMALTLSWTAVEWRRLHDIRSNILSGTRSGVRSHHSQLRGSVHFQKSLLSGKMPRNRRLWLSCDYFITYRVKSDERKKRAPHVGFQDLSRTFLKEVKENLREGVARHHQPERELQGDGGGSA